jgi:hypothetical protein
VDMQDIPGFRPSTNERGVSSTFRMLEGGSVIAVAAFESSGKTATLFHLL